MVQKYKCQICETAEFKYKCSACQVLYCSVACYKQHKAETSCGGSATSSSVPEKTLPPIEPPSNCEGVTDQRATLRPLSSLRWPPEPETSMFIDPLTRDDPKPLKNSQYLVIATSPKIRSMLRDDPRLPLILRSLDSLSSYARERALKVVLGVSTGGPDLVQLDNGEYMDADDMELMRLFVEEVEKAVRKPDDLGLVREEAD